MLLMLCATCYGRTVKESVRNCLQEYLQQVKSQPSHPGSVAEMTLTVVRMLDINIAELERILADLERCDQL